MIVNNGCCPARPRRCTSAPSARSCSRPSRRVLGRVLPSAPAAAPTRRTRITREPELVATLDEDARERHRDQRRGPPARHGRRRRTHPRPRRRICGALVVQRHEAARARRPLRTRASSTSATPPPRSPRALGLRHAVLSRRAERARTPTAATALISTSIPGSSRSTRSVVAAGNGAAKHLAPHRLEHREVLGPRQVHRLADHDLERRADRLAARSRGSRTPARICASGSPIPTSAPSAPNGPWPAANTSGAFVTTAWEKSTAAPTAGSSARRETWGHGSRSSSFRSAASARDAARAARMPDSIAPSM